MVAVAVALLGKLLKHEALAARAAAAMVELGQAAQHYRFRAVAQVLRTLVAVVAVATQAAPAS
jgi:hypothetical protein